MRQFYKEYPKSATLSHQLSWSHYVELLKIDDKKHTTHIPQTITTNYYIPEYLLKNKKFVVRNSFDNSSDLFRW